MTYEELTIDKFITFLASRKSNKERTDILGKVAESICFDCGQILDEYSHCFCQLKRIRPASDNHPDYL